MREPVGIPFGSYQLLRRLARGGMAEVFLARQKGLEGFDRLVAIKRILPHLVDNDEFVRMFFDEARLAAQLSHPNIVHIYEFGKVEDHYFIAMEWVDGVHAGQLIKRAETDPIPDVLIARIGADACSGLHYSHEMRDGSGRPLQIVHRDVSPANLIASFDGAVKLVDFGIAKAVSCVEQTRPGVVKGKFAYMSPEQTVGKPLDGRSDVYSLAIVLWEMLAGRVMVPREDPVEGMRMIRDDRVPRIEDVRTDVPLELAGALAKALANDKNRRSTALELGLALESFIKSSVTGIGSSLELSQWVRARFVREPPSGRQATLGSPGTRPATQATRHTAAATHATSALAARSGSAVALDPIESIQGATAAHTPSSIKRQPVGRRLDSVIIESGLGERADDDADRSGTTPSRFEAALGTASGPDDLVREAAQAGDEPNDTVPFDRYDLAPSAGTSLTGIVDLLPTQLEPTPVGRLVRPRRRSAVLLAGGGVALAVAALVGWRVTRLLMGEAPAAPPDAGRVALAGAPDAAPVAGPILEVTTSPEGAAVVIQPGDRRGTAPARFERLTPGTYSVAVVLDGYHPLTHKIVLTDGDYRTLEIPLQPIAVAAPPVPPPTEVEVTRPKKRGREKREERRPRPAATRPTAETGNLTVRTRPYSEVYLGSRLLGMTPLAGLELPAGEYVLTFRNPDRDMQQRRVVIKPGETTKLDFALK